MKTFSRLALSLLVAVFLALSFSSASAQQLVSRASRATTLPLNVASIITTLYANDPIAHSLCFTDGKEGGVFQDGEPRNRCSHIEFDAYKMGSLSVGIEGGELGRIIDLGSDDDLSKQYGYQQTVGKGQGFASIEFRDGKLVIMKAAGLVRDRSLRRQRHFLRPAKVSPRLRRKPDISISRGLPIHTPRIFRYWSNSWC